MFVVLVPGYILNQLKPQPGLSFLLLVSLVSVLYIRFMFYASYHDFIFSEFDLLA